MMTELEHKVAAANFGTRCQVGIPVDCPKSSTTAVTVRALRGSLALPACEGCAEGERSRWRRR